MWYYRLQQRLALTTIELRVLIALLAFFFLGIAVQHWPQSLPYDADTYAEEAAALAAAARDSSEETAPEDSLLTGSDTGHPEAAGVLPDGRINLNTASAVELQRLTGIGPALAGRIVEDRTVHGPFARVSDLTRVSGIGPRTLERLKPDITVE